MVKDDMEIELKEDFGDVPEKTLNNLGMLRTCVTTFIVNISTICLGMVSGWLAPVELLFQSENSPIGSKPLTKDEISWLNAILFLGGIVGTLVWAHVADFLGRKGAGYLLVIPLTINWTLTLFCDKFWLLFLAKFLGGLSMSGILINTPLYIGEVCHSSLKGPLGSSFTVFINLGYLLVYFLGDVLSYFHLNLVCFILPLIYLLGFYFLPETPTYLLRCAKEAEAKASLMFFCGDDKDLTNDEFNILTSSSNSSKPKFSALYDKKSSLWAVIIAVVLIMFQQLAGISVLLSYTASNFKAVGTSITPATSTVIVGLLQLLTSILSCFLINRLGRKNLLILSSVGMSTFLLIFAICFLLKDYNYTFYASSKFPVPLITYSLAVMFYSLGFGPVPYVLLVEIFPSHIRNLATSLVMVSATLGSFLTTKLFPIATELFGYFWCFSFFSVASLFLSLFVHLRVPETKNRSLNAVIEQLENYSIGFSSKFQQFK